MENKVHKFMIGRELANGNVMFDSHMYKDNVYLMTDETAKDVANRVSAQEKEEYSAYRLEKIN